jgi:hypothetical protein
MQFNKDICKMCFFFYFKGPVVVVQERGGDPEEALGNCYQPPGNKGARTRFRKVLFHLHGEYRNF